MARVRHRRFLSVLALTALVVAPPRVAGQVPGLNLDTATIADLQAAFASGVLTSERLVEAYLARMDAYDQQGPRLNAVIVRNPKALADAGTDLVVEQAIATLKTLGAVVVDPIKYPDLVMVPEDPRRDCRPGQRFEVRLSQPREGGPDLIVPAGMTKDGLQRGEAAGLRLRLRAGDQGARAAEAHTRARQRCPGAGGVAVIVPGRGDHAA